VPGGRACSHFKAGLVRSARESCCLDCFCGFGGFELTITSRTYVMAQKRALDGNEEKDDLSTSWRLGPFWMMLTLNPFKMLLFAWHSGQGKAVAYRVM
jgi:hypothetical protein